MTLSWSARAHWAPLVPYCALSLPFEQLGDVWPLLSALMVVESGGEGTGLSLLGFWQSSLVLVHQ